MAESANPSDLRGTISAPPDAPLSRGTMRLGEAIPRVARSSDPLIGDLIEERYRIIRKLGEGGMGLVFEAEREIFGTRVALKVLRADSAGGEALARLEREAKSASAIGHAHIVDVKDFGRLPDGSTYIVMELIEGDDLLTEIRRERLPWKRARAIAAQICEALAAAHERGIIHRDLKPENIILTTREGEADFVKIVDFGIARVSGATKLTAAGQVVGTPEYMSPEQCAGEELDGRADIYALGVLLYEMVTGELPFYSDDLIELLRQQLREPPVPPSRLMGSTELDLGFEAVILRCLAKRPGQRFASMNEVGEALRSLDAGEIPELDDDEAEFFPGPLRSPSGSIAAVEASPPRQRSRAPMLAGFAALALVVLAAGAFAFAPTSEVGPAEPEPAAQPPDPVPAPPRHAAPPEPEAPAPLNPQPAEYITIESDPPGATVFEGGAPIGATPLELRRPEGGDLLSISIREEGFQARALILNRESAERVSVVMVRDARSRARPVASPAAPASQPASSQHPRRARPEFLDPWR